MTFAVRNAGFRFSAQRDRAGDITGLRVDRRCVLAGAVERENPLRNRIVNDRVRILSGRRRSQNLQRLEIENRDRAIAAIADESFIEFRCYRDPMDAIGVGNVSDDSTRVGIDNHHVRAARDVNTPRFAIDSQIIPAAFAANLVSLGDVITGWTSNGHSCDQE